MKSLRPTHVLLCRAVAVIALVLSPTLGPSISAAAAAPAFGLFDAHSDLGKILHPGNAVFDVAKNNYTLTGGGDNIWATADNFQFVWKKMSGDLSLGADLDFLSTTTHPQPTSDHRKVVLMIRQSLDADSPYVDVSRQGDGMAAMQFRSAKGGESFEIRVSQASPKRLRIEKHGDSFTFFFAAQAGETPRFTGAATTLVLEEPFYVGLGVCSHGDDNLETAVFSQVELKTGPFTNRPRFYRTIETQSAASVPASDRYALFTSTDSISSPVWLPDTSALVFIKDGSLFRLPVSPTPEKNMNGQVDASSPRPASGPPVALSTGTLSHLLGPLSLSPDGKLFVFTNQVGSLPSIYSMPVGGGAPRLLVQKGKGSSLSPDGSTLVFSTTTGGGFPTIYTRVLAGPDDPRQLTKAGSSFDPAYSADGSTIYFTSVRSNRAEVWKMNADGTGQEQLTDDENQNYFASVSPTAPGVLLFTADRDPASVWGVAGSPDNTHTTVRRLNANHSTDILARILGGPGTAPGWSQDGKFRTWVSEAWVYED